MKRIPLSGERGSGLFALVDDEDYDRVMEAGPWYLFESCGHRYAKAPNNTFMHRLVNDTPSGMLTDHIDNDGLNNQRHNLRNATSSQNCHNSGPRAGRYKGVSKDPRGNYIATIKAETKNYYLGSHSSAEAAALAYDNAARALVGDYAYQNLPDIQGSRFLLASSETKVALAERERRTQLAAIALDVTEGIAPKRIAKMYRAPLSRVLEACEAHHLRIPERHRKPYRATTDASREALRLVVHTHLRDVDIAERVGLTRERVRQIRMRAFLAGLLPASLTLARTLSAPTSRAA